MLWALGEISLWISVAPCGVNSKMLEYKGFSATVEYSVEDRVFYGTVSGISDLVSFYAENAADIESEFKTAIDGYLALCAEIGKKP